jgi:uncharacterized protein YeaO (DUF488 family)
MKHPSIVPFSGAASRLTIIIDTDKSTEFLADNMAVAIKTVAIKRVYEPASRADGTRILVDRLWPRGVAKAAARVDEWLRDLAPSDELRRWFHARLASGQESDWQAFRKKYLKELSQPETEKSLRKLYLLAQEKKRLTLLYGSKNETHNNAVVLKELLEGMRKPPTGTGPGAIQSSRKRLAAALRR